METFEFATGFVHNTCMISAMRSENSVLCLVGSLEGRGILCAARVIMLAAFIVGRAPLYSKMHTVTAVRFAIAASVAHIVLPEMPACSAGFLFHIKYLPDFCFFQI
jgi:hypothetical protein